LAQVKRKTVFFILTKKMPFAKQESLLTMLFMQSKNLQEGDLNISGKEGCHSDIILHRDRRLLAQSIS